MNPARGGMLAGIAVALASALSACDRDIPDVTITAQDYRFSPSLVEAQAHTPTRLTIYNGGRELHEFTSRLLTDHRVMVTAIDHHDGLSPQGVFRIGPGKRARFTIEAPSGVYEFHCRIRGHRGMKGLFLIK